MCHTNKLHKLASTQLISVTFLDCVLSPLLRLIRFQGDEVFWLVAASLRSVLHSPVVRLRSPLLGRVHRVCSDAASQRRCTARVLCRRHSQPDQQVLHSQDWSVQNFTSVFFQTMSHIVKSCPLTKLSGGLSQLHSADEDTVLWLTSYGS